MKKSQELENEQSSRLRKLFSLSFLTKIFLLLFLILFWISGFDFADRGGEFSRQLVVWFVAILVSVTWLGSMIQKNQLSLRGGWWNIVIPIFWILVGLSVLFSVNPFTSLFGSDVVNGDGLTLLALSIVGFIFFQEISAVDRGRVITFVLLLGNIFLGILALVGIAAEDRLLIFWRTFSTFPHELTAMAFAVFAAFALIEFSRNTSWKKLTAAGIGIFDLIMVGWWGTPLVWIVVSVGLLTLLGIFALHAKEISRSWSMGVSIALVLSILFWATPFGNVLNPDKETRLSFQNSWDIVRTTWDDHLWFGIGPENWTSAYLENYPRSLNNQPEGRMVFSKGTSELLTIAATAGLIPLIFGIGLWTILVFFIVRRFIQGRTPQEYRVEELFIVPFVMMSAAALILPFTLSLSVLFVIATAFVLWWLWATSGEKIRATSFDRTPKLSFALSMVFGVVCVSAAVWIFVGVQHARAAKIGKLAQEISAAKSAYEFSLRAHRAAPWDFLAALGVFQTYRNYWFDAEAAGDLPERLSDLANLENRVKDDAFGATAIAETYSALWSVTGTELTDRVLISWDRVVQLRSQDARAYLLAADTRFAIAESIKDAGQQKKLQKDGMILLDQAVRLQRESENAILIRVRGLNGQGKTEEAVTVLEKFIQENSSAVNAKVQLGAQYNKLQRYTDAKEILTSALTLVPEHDSARLLRADVLKQLGETAAAKEDLLALQKKYPDDTRITDRLTNLETPVVAEENSESTP